MLMVGSPGSGKTLMAKCFASILPPLDMKEAIELTKFIASQVFCLQKNRL